MRVSKLRLLLALLVGGGTLLGAGRLTPIAAQSDVCTDYDSQIWAQSVYETDRTAYAGLDPDGNGVACDELAPGAAPAWWTSDIPAGAQVAELVSVTDGDTIRVLVDGIVEPVQLSLIDAPEVTSSATTPECFGQQASDFLSALLWAGGALYLETDVSDRDEEGRLLRYAWLDFGDGYVYQVNEAMARSGFATALANGGTYEAEIWAATSFASEHGYGLWWACTTDAEGDTNELV